MITDKWIDDFKQKDTLPQLATLIIEKVLNNKENVEKLWNVLEDKDIFLEYVKYICLPDNEFSFAKNSLRTDNIQGFYHAIELKELQSIFHNYDKTIKIDIVKHRVEVFISSSKNNSELFVYNSLYSFKSALRRNLLYSTLVQKIVEYTSEFPKTKNSYQYALYHYLKNAINKCSFHLLTKDMLRFMCCSPFNEFTEKHMIYITTPDNDFNAYMYHCMFYGNGNIWKGMLSFAKNVFICNDVWLSEDRLENCPSYREDAIWLKLLMTNYSFDKVKRSLYDCIFFLAYGKQHLSQDQIQELQYNIKEKILDKNINAKNIPIYLFDEEDLKIIGSSLFVKKLQQNIK